MKTFIYLNHQNKGRVFKQTLLNSGWREVRMGESAEICLADSDVTPSRSANLDKIAQKCHRIIIYPHAARPPVYYDFEGYPANRNVAAQLVTTPVHADILRVIGYSKPIFPVGWLYCPQKQFKPIQDPKKILFAPIHPNANGWLSDQHKEINQIAFERALKISIDVKGSLLVRYLHTLEACGLERNSRASYTDGRPDQSHEHIDHSDLVISTQTFQYIAVARGKPTIGMGEGISPLIGNSPETLQPALKWDEYKHMMMFPLDILDDTDTSNLVRAASLGCPEVSSWRERLVGNPYSDRNFLNIVEKCIIGQAATGRATLSSEARIDQAAARI